MTSRISQRSARKQEKFRRHIKSLNASETSEKAPAQKEETKPKEEPKSAASIISSRYRSSPSRPRPVYNQRNLSTPTSDDTLSEANPNPSKGGRSEGSVEAPAPSLGYLGRRKGRSLTRSTSTNSRASSVSSENSEEPGRIRTRSRPGRSLTRASSKGPSDAIRSRSSSINAKTNSSKPPMKPSEESMDSKTKPTVSAVDSKTTPTASTSGVLKSARFRNRSRNRRSLSREPQTPEPTTTSGNPPESNAVTTVRPSSGRSPFSRLIADKQASKAKLKATIPLKQRKALVPPKASVKTAPIKKEASREAPRKHSDAESSIEEPGRIPTVSTADSGEGKSNMVSTPSVEAEAVPEVEPKKQDAEKSVLFDEYEDSQLEEDAKNISVLSEENVEKHFSTVASAEDEFGDPPLEEIESEVSVGTSNAAQNYFPKDSILSSFATSPIHEDNNETTVFPEKVEEKKEESPLESNTVNEEKKEPDIGNESKAAPAWDLSNKQFSNLVASVTKSSDDDIDMLFDSAPWIVNEKNSEPSSVDKESPQSDSKEATTMTKVDKEKMEPDEFDMFDTSSWAAGGTEASFSNQGFPELNQDIESERNFVNMMKEEMKFRTLTDGEREMVFQAQKAINEAEERAAAERNTVAKDDEPLLTKSKIDEGANDTASLENRLKSYATVVPDLDSEVGSAKSSTEASSEEEAETEVEYVDQNNEEEDLAGTDAEITPSEAPLVPSNDVPTLEVAASAAISAQDSFVIPQTLSELKMIAPPPPPPPGLPKKKKKKKSKKKKSSSNEAKAIPLIAPPPEEKMKKWENEQQRAQNYLSAMKERLEHSETKALDGSSEYFHFKPVDENKAESIGVNNEVIDLTEVKDVEGEECNPEQEIVPQIDEPTFEKATIENTKPVSETSEKAPQDDGEKPMTPVESEESDKEDSVSKFAEEVRRQNEKTVSMLSAQSNNLWRKEVENAMGLVERLEDEYGKDFPGINSDLTPFSLDDISRKKSGESASAATQSKLPGVDCYVQENPSDALTSQDSKDLNGTDIVEKISDHTLEDPKDGEGTDEMILNDQPLEKPKDDEGTFETVLDDKTPQEPIDDEGTDEIGLDDQPLEESKDDEGTDDVVLEEPTNDPAQIREEVQQGPSNDSEGSEDDMLVKDRLLSVNTSESPKEERPTSMFSTPKKTMKPDKRQTSTTNSILTGYMMADKVAMASSAAANTFENRFTPRGEVKGKPKKPISAEKEAIAWFAKDIMKKELTTVQLDACVSETTRSLLKKREPFNAMCKFIADRINEVSIEIKPSLKFAESTMSSFDQHSFASKSMTTASSNDSGEESVEQPRVLLKPLVLSDATMTLSQKYLAANFVSFLFMASKLAKVKSPFGDKNPFLAMIVASSMQQMTEKKIVGTTMQDLLFAELDGKAEQLVQFAYKVKMSCDADMTAFNVSQIPSEDEKVESIEGKEIDNAFGRRNIVPDSHPSPFEASILEVPRIVAAVLSFIGDPVAICQMKTVNTACRRIIVENEHTLMQDAVRVGGIDPSLRPAFWMWIALEKSDLSNLKSKFGGSEDLIQLEKGAKEGKWHHVIKRDVERSFGNMPPHKTGAKLRADSIVTALVTWGQNRIMKRGVKGGGEPVPIPEVGTPDEKKQKTKRKSTNVSSPPWERKEKIDGDESVKSETNITPADTVTDWGAVSPKGSFVGSTNDSEARPEKTDVDAEEIALCGNSLSPEVKSDLQEKLSFILHSLSASYEEIGYCQGMDYVVAHLLRNLQDTIRWKAANQTLPPIISSASSVKTILPLDAENIDAINKDIDGNHIVEETVIRMMDTFFVNYNLRHMYWPELRCLKTCCRVFERLIQQKLPVLADHFDHHDLNIGLFALGWFQTLFLYLPSMPSATVCHMWDIWLVERSFKIFFRVGTAILFLSQPTLLNHELEGMMTYLNTIPDATLLRPDILIPCALNIKVTNRMLQELEDEVVKNP